MSISWHVSEVENRFKRVFLGPKWGYDNGKEALGGRQPTIFYFSGILVSSFFYFIVTNITNTKRFSFYEAGKFLKMPSASPAKIVVTQYSCCDTTISSKFLITKERWSSAKKNQFFFILPSKPWHGTEIVTRFWCQTFSTLTFQNRVTPAKIVTRFASQFSNFLLPPKSRYATQIASRFWWIFQKNISVTLKSRHGKTQPWRDFARAYKYPTSFKNFPHPFFLLLLCPIFPWNPNHKFYLFSHQFLTILTLPNTKLTKNLHLYTINLH